MHWTQVEEEIDIWITEQVEETLSNNNFIRNKIYTIYSRLIDGYMGKGRRKRLSACIEINVRSMYPKEDGKYTGFKDIK
jgi:hypothetical protein